MGDVQGLRESVSTLKQESARVNTRMEEIATNATSASEVASNALTGVERYLGGFVGPLNGVVGAIFDEVRRGLEDHSDKLDVVDSRTTANREAVVTLRGDLRSEMEEKFNQLRPETQAAISRVQVAEADIARLREDRLDPARFDERLNQLLEHRGLSSQQVAELRATGLTSEEILAMLGIGTAGLVGGTGGGIFASKRGKSRSEGEIREVKGKVEALEHTLSRPVKGYESDSTDRLT